MRKNLLTFALMTLTAVSICAQQPARARTTTTQARTADIFAFVPQSDGIVVVDVDRLLNETLPRVFAGDTAKLAQINSEIDKFKTQTGIDARAFNRVVVAARYTYPSAKVTKLEPVAIAQGKFDVKALTLAARLAAKGNAREEKYRGATITILTINDQIKLFGLWNMRVRDLALTALNSNTVAVGTPATVRATIDAARTPRRDSADLVSLATRDPQAVIGFGANVPAALWAHLNLGNDATAQDASSIRQAYGSLGTTATDVSLTLVARTETPAAAKNLGDILTGLKQLAGFMIMQMTGDKKALAQSALENLKINARGNEIEIRTQVAAANLASLMK
ncbi:MAG TPA: hypothetical protein VGJ69_13925 [Pyrinomonadaceae bacterium]